MIPLQVATRILAFVGKELVEVVRRPGALASLVLGPFLIMALFGFGYDPSHFRLRAVLVVPPGSGLSSNLADYADIRATGGDLVGVVTDPAAGRRALEDGSADLVIYAPSDLRTNLEAGRQSTIRVEYDQVSPAKADYAIVLAERLSYAVNQALIERAAADGLSAAGAGGQAAIPAKVIAAPTTAEAKDIAPTTPDLTSFFGPAVVALILQHMAVTLTALSLVRERHTGVLDVLRVSAVSAAEIVAGKAIAFGALGGVVGLAVMGLLAGGLHVPFLGDPSLVAASVALVLAASLGLGLLISVVSDSERQAVQLALLVLLASVFFSGFLLDLDQFVPLVQGIGYLLPVTHGIQLLQDLLLRGSAATGWHFASLAGIAAVTLLLSWWLLHRGMAPQKA